MEKYFIYNGGELSPVSNNKDICGLYAAIGFNGETAGNLFAVVPGPRLVPVYDETGKRQNVGADLAGYSYSLVSRCWYQE